MSMTLTELVGLTRPFTVENRKRSWTEFYLTASAIAGLAGLIASAILILGPDGVGIDFSTVIGQGLILLLSLTLGLTLVRLFILYHDYQHGAIFYQSKPAKWLMSAVGVLLLNPPSIWNRSHNYHHKFNSQIFTAAIGSYPILTVKDYYSASLSQKLAYRFARHWLTIATGYLTIFILGMCLKPFLRDPKRHWDSALALLVHGTLLALTYRVLGLEGTLWLVCVPYSVCCALGAYLFYAQHNFPSMMLKGRADWDFGFAALRSSSFLVCGPLLNWFTGNIGYHHVHHLNSRIPFYRLPETMEAVKELQNPGRTSLAPSDVLACLRLKLWDPVSQRMLNWKEAQAAWGSLSHRQDSNESLLQHS